MATLTITIPNPILNRVLDGYAYQHGYQDEIPDTPNTTKPNPETKNQFVRRILEKHIKQSVRVYERRRDEELAGKAADDKVESEISLTVT